MASAKLLLLVAITTTLLMAASAGVRDSFVAQKITDNYKTTNTKEVYRFNFYDEDGSSREEIGTIVKPGTEEEQLVVMGSYTVIGKQNPQEMPNYDQLDPKIQPISRGALKMTMFHYSRPIQPFYPAQENGS